VVRPILATLAIWTFLSTWNDFMWPLIVLSDDSMFTLPVALANLSGERVQDTELMMAGAVLTTLPVMLVFVFLQRYYVEGITMGQREGMSAMSRRFTWLIVPVLAAALRYRP
jgi:multiple sugar transport system permease protein